MTPRVELGLWVLAAAMCGAGIWITERPAANLLALPALGQAAVVSAPSVALLRRGAEEVIDDDPFRWDRQPADVAFGSEPKVEVKVAPPAAPVSFSFALRGIVGGPPWEALMEGLPGKSGPVLVRAGDKFGEVTVKEVKKDSVVVQGAATTWRLALTRVWR